MRTKIVMIVFGVGLALAAAGQTQAPSKKTSTPPPQPKETFWERVLRISGVSANPNTLKGADDEPVSGQIWMADLPSGATRRLTEEFGYRSPIFYSNGTDILALQGADVVRISSGGGRGVKLFHIAGITKFVGFSIDDPDQALMLKEDEAGRASVSLLSVKTGAVALLPYDPQSSRDRQMLEDLQGWQRTYGGTTVYLKRESRDTLSGTVEISNVFAKSAGRDPINISRCDMTNCGQPSLSPDGNHVLFIKGEL
ncbi:MAG TPA: hypothetical protein VKB79_16280 [Bryobacteraceae bacterium]|nr:hypothetical protein [Bryobacteraceae bacterium]